LKDNGMPFPISQRGTEYSEKNLILIRSKNGTKNRREDAKWTQNGGRKRRIFPGGRIF